MNRLDAQFTALQQAAGQAGLGGLGCIGGSALNQLSGNYSLFGDALLERHRQEFQPSLINELLLRQQRQRDAQNIAVRQEGLTRPAYIGKVTPKPGVIKEFGDYRWKTWSDYKLWERVVIWFHT